MTKGLGLWVTKFFLFLLLSVAVLSPAVCSAEDWGREAKVPLVSKRCIAQGRFSCYEYEHTLNVEGVRCTEDCLVLSNLNTCRLSNRCVYDVPSGCFLKQVCVDISDLKTCRTWEEQVLCR